MFPHEMLWTFTLNKGQAVPVFLLASMGIGATGPDLGPEQSTQINFYRSEIAHPPNHGVSHHPFGFQSLQRWSGDNPQHHVCFWELLDEGDKTPRHCSRGTAGRGDTFGGSQSL